VLKFPCCHREARPSYHSAKRYRAAGDYITSESDLLHKKTHGGLSRQPDDVVLLCEPSEIACGPSNRTKTSCSAKLSYNI